MSTEVAFAVEGETDVPIVEKLIRRVDRVPRRVLVAGGKSKLDLRLESWNQASNRLPFLVLRDWDRSDGAACPSELLSKILGGQLSAPAMAVRVPVRASESWLMADRDACAAFFGTNHLPALPDDEAEPKVALVNACRRSKRKDIQTAMVPREGSHRVVGQLYEAHVIAFGRDHWDVDRARTRSPSLDRAMNRLQQLVDTGIW